MATQTMDTNRRKDATDYESSWKCECGARNVGFLVLKGVNCLGNDAWVKCHSCGNATGNGNSIKMAVSILGRWHKDGILDDGLYELLIATAREYWSDDQPNADVMVLAPDPDFIVVDENYDSDDVDDDDDDDDDTDDDDSDSDEYYTDSTVQTYLGRWGNFQRWCEARRVKAMPVKPSNAIAYLTEKTDAGLAAPTVRAAWTAIAFMHRHEGHDAIADDQSVRDALNRMLSNRSKPQTQPQRNKPATEPARQTKQQTQPQRNTKPAPVQEPAKEATTTPRKRKTTIPGANIVLTGTLSEKRNLIIARITALGGNVMQSVSGNTDFVVLGELRPGKEETTKLDKARNWTSP